MQEPLSTLPEDVRRVMREVGPVWGSDIQKHRDRVLAAYAPLLAASPKEGVAVTRDIPYGTHARQVLDVFRPEKPGVAAGAPVVVFVHGGAFLRGSKCAPEGIYDNVLYWFARQGCVGVNVEYRLAPEAPYPCGALDVGAAVDWVRDNAARFGGDPKRLFLVGHSAGATHVCSYALDPDVPAKPGAELAGLVLVSGRLRIDALPQNPNTRGVRSYFGDDDSVYARRSPVSYAHLCARPVMIAIAQYENPLLDIYGAEFFWRVSAARGRSPRFVRMRGHNHSSMMFHFNTGEEILGREILGFIATGE